MKQHRTGSSRNCFGTQGDYGEGWRSFVCVRKRLQSLSVQRSNVVAALALVRYDLINVSALASSL